jgi:hypothetical protein
MTDRGVAYLQAGGLGAGAAYLNWVSTYGTAAVTTLAILVAFLTAVNQGRQLYLSFRRRRTKEEEDHAESATE